MNSTEQKNAEDKKIREENNRQMIADYKLQYRRVTGKQCPEIELKRAWISVGIVSFRPPEFEQEIKVLQSRPDYKDHATDVENIRLLREKVGKPFIVPEGKKLRQPENWVEMSMKEKSKYILNFSTGVCNCTPSIGESCKRCENIFIDY